MSRKICCGSEKKMIKLNDWCPKLHSRWSSPMLLLDIFAGRRRDNNNRRRRKKKTEKKIFLLLLKCEFRDRERRRQRPKKSHFKEYWMGHRRRSFFFLSATHNYPEDEFEEKKVKINIFLVREYFDIFSIMREFNAGRGCWVESIYGMHLSNKKLKKCLNHLLKFINFSMSNFIMKREKLNMHWEFQLQNHQSSRKRQHDSTDCLNCCAVNCRHISSLKNHSRGSVRELRWITIWRLSIGIPTEYHLLFYEAIID